MGTVVFNAANFTIYGPSGAGATQTEADAFIASSANPTAYGNLVAADKTRMLIAAFRMLERKKWNTSTAVDFVTRNALPAVVSGGPLVFAQAQYELAAILAADQNVNAARTTGSNVKRVDAKGVSVEFFRATDALLTSTPLPPIVMDLVGQYLAASGTALNVAFNTASGSFDTCQRSAFDDCAGYDRKDPF